ncbi:MAG: hypothetical protein G3M78_07435 [Candidatus Nitrohelix vancouverensis]|uniref:Uncharacterized protein n=1 Tax=Candidatus Nitrohelix vancouverensis TaxID=2705534 RepID=A0A7T0C2B6_9BACT|nr:MAG: hypothetical protein G3M78_07435 [Candidatus Nitrohelix vancouverensis]
MQSVFLTIFIIFFVFKGEVSASRLFPEKAYQAYWCQQAQGQTEVRLIDRTRVDCLTTQHAIEFDFGSKWAEAIGQALHYSMATGKEAGIVLILETEEDGKYWIRLNNIIQRYHLGIHTWKIHPEALNQAPK